MGNLTAIRNDEAVASAFDQHGQVLVLDDGGLQLFVAANRIVDAALDEDELPVGDGILAAGVIDLAGGKPDRQPGENQRQDDALPESGDFLPGHNGEQVRVGLLRHSKDRGEGGRKGEGIGIDEAEPVRAGEADSLEEGVRLAGPTGRKLGAVEHGQAGVAGGAALQYLRRGVGGAVVQDDQLEIGIGLGEQAVDTALDVAGLVAGRDDD